MLEHTEYYEDENLSTYTTDLENKGKHIETKIANEMEIWEDEFGNLWEVGLEVIRDFKNAVPKN
tara:strand:+ start:54 stop:245 length:192 start_codon:yes stop_codon:yes gene_type:complete